MGRRSRGQDAAFQPRLKEEGPAVDKGCPPSPVQMTRQMSVEGRPPRSPPMAACPGFLSQKEFVFLVLIDFQMLPKEVLILAVIVRRA